MEFSSAVDVVSHDDGVATEGKRNGGAVMKRSRSVVSFSFIDFVFLFKNKKIGQLRISLSPPTLSAEQNRQKNNNNKMRSEMFVVYRPRCGLLGFYFYRVSRLALLSLVETAGVGG